MRLSLKLLAAFALGAGAFGFTAASADDHGRGSRHDSRYDSRADDCRIDHDHRAHDARYYDHHPADRYSRAGAYRGGAAVSVTISTQGRSYDRHDRRDSRYAYGYGDRYREGRPVNREIYDTRYRAHIVLVEEVSHSRRGARLTCTVSARGPEAYRVPRSHLKRVAVRECAPRSHIIVRA